MRHTLTFILLLFTLCANAQQNKFRMPEGPISGHAFGPVGAVGYAYQRGHFLQLSLIYGTNYNHPNNSFTKRTDTPRYNKNWHYSVFGLGMGADIGWLPSGRVYGPKVFVEFETYQKTLFYRINAIQYFIGEAHDMRIMPEFGVYLGKNNHIAILGGYSQPVKKQIKEIGRFRIGLNVYPAVLNGITYKTARERRSDTAAFKPVQGIKEPDMVYVQGGTFTMGANMYNYKDNKVLNVVSVPTDETPEHEVTLSDYYIGKNEVTYAEFREFVNQTGYMTEKVRIARLNRGIFYQLGILRNDQGSCFWNGQEWQNRHLNLHYDTDGDRRASHQDDQPVIYITVNDALKYCEWLSVQTGKKYRLPTEAEWEYAAAGGNKSRNYMFPGSNTLEEVAWYKNNSRKTTHKVGLKKPNELGINDMAGNVMEMCSDWYDAFYYNRPQQSDPQGPWQSSTTDRSYSIRGSSWAGAAADSRTTRRNFCEMGTASNTLGFRLVAEK